MIYLQMFPLNVERNARLDVCYFVWKMFDSFGKDVDISLFEGDDTAYVSIFLTQTVTAIEGELEVLPIIIQKLIQDAGVL